MATETPPRRLQRETVNLTPRSADALALAVQLSGDNKTDVMNRALRVYSRLLQLQARGNDLLIRENQEHGSITERLEFL